MTCQELVELVTEYLDGALPPSERVRFEAHVADCEGCRRHLEQVRETIRIAGALPPEQLDEDARRDLLAAFHDWKRSA
jgi:anti-sigma factor RsiW